MKCGTARDPGPARGRPRTRPRGPPGSRSRRARRASRCRCGRAVVHSRAARSRAPLAERQDLVPEPVQRRARVLHDIPGLDQRAEQPMRRAAPELQAVGDLHHPGVLNAGKQLEHGEAANKRMDRGVTRNRHPKRNGKSFCSAESGFYTRVCLQNSSSAQQNDSPIRDGRRFPSEAATTERRGPHDYRHRASHASSPRPARPVARAAPRRPPLASPRAASPRRPRLALAAPAPRARRRAPRLAAPAPRRARASRRPLPRARRARRTSHAAAPAPRRARRAVAPTPRPPGDPRRAALAAPPTPARRACRARRATAARAPRRRRRRVARRVAPAPPPRLAAAPRAAARARRSPRPRQAPRHPPAPPEHARPRPAANSRGHPLATA